MPTITPTPTWPVRSCKSLVHSGNLRSSAETRTWLSVYIDRLARLGHIKAPIQTLALQSVSNLQNSASSLHRAATTPSPAPYTFHLKMSIWAFLLFLPLQQYTNLGWSIVVVQFVVALVYLGFIQVGIVVANPFTLGTGKNGKALLPMDQITGRIEAQLEKITGVSRHPD